MTTLVTVFAVLAAGLVAVGAEADKAEEPSRPRVRQMDRPAEKPADGGRAGGRQPATLGVVTGPVTEELREHANLPEHGGLLITRVEAGGPAARAGLKVNDVLLTFDGVDVASPLDLAEMIDAAGAGTKVELGIVRRGRPQQINVLLTARRERAVAGGGPESGGPAGEARLPMPGPPPNAENLLAQALGMAQAVPAGGVGLGSSIQVQSSIVNGVADIRAVSRDREGTVEITSRGGRKTVAILGPDGSEIHAGPLDEPADFKSVPEEWRDKVHALDDRAGSGVAGAPVPLGGI